MGHITIARVKLIKDKKKLLGFLKEFDIEDLLNPKINEFSFKKSELTNNGSLYGELEKYRFESNRAFK